jgi:hypothetical protein
MNIILRITAAIAMIGAGWLASKNAEYIEYLIVDAGWSGWFLSAYVSRIFTGSLIALGALLVFLPGNKKFIINSSIVLVVALLLLTSIQPFVLDLTRCYICLSEFEKISRYQGIYLWAAVLAVLVAVKLSSANAKSIFPRWTAYILLLAGLSVPFILNYPAHWAIYGEVASKEIQRDLELSKVDTVHFLAGNHEYDPSVWKEKRVLMLASLSCPFCSRAAYKLHVIKKENPDFPVTVFLTGDTITLKTFIRRNLMDNVPYQLFNGPVFNQLCEGRVPRIFLVDKGVAIKEVHYWGLFPEIIE